MMAPNPLRTTPDARVFPAPPAAVRPRPRACHELTLQALRAPGGAALLHTLYGVRVPSLPVTCMGLRFPNPLGLAAGLDKQAAAVGGLAALGFGFLELAPSPRARSPATRARACSGCRRRLRSSTAWASTAAGWSHFWLT